MDRLEAACRFYEKNGFTRVDAADLPVTFPRMRVDNRFYAIRITGLTPIPAQSSAPSEPGRQ
jgi:hypothetical protein